MAAKSEHFDPGQCDAGQGQLEEGGDQQDRPAESRLLRLLLQENHGGGQEKEFVVI